MPVTFGLILCLVVVVILFFIFLSAGDDDNADQDDESVKRRILRLPIAESIARTSDNQDARLRGTLIYAERTAPLRAPISDRPCTAWRVVVEERRSDDDENTRWEQVVDDSEASHFFLEDESGRAHVAGGALTLALDFDANDAQGLLDVGTPALRAFM